MLVKLKNPPSSSSWNFRGVVRGYEVWAARSGKRFYKDAAGNWYKVTKNESISSAAKGAVQPG